MNRDLVAPESCEVKNMAGEVTEQPAQTASACVLYARAALLREVTVEWSEDLVR